MEESHIVSNMTEFLGEVNHVCGPIKSAIVLASSVVGAAICGMIALVVVPNDSIEEENLNEEN